MMTFNLILRALTREPGAILALGLIFAICIAAVGIFGDLPALPMTESHP